MDNIIKTINGIAETISLTRIVGVALLFVVLIIISRCLTRLTGRILARSKLGESFGGFITAIAKYVLYFISLLIVCDALGLPITSLLAVFSLFGLAVSLSVQSLLSNLMSGLTVHTLKPFTIGDYIETDIAGTVQNIGLFYTELLTPDNKRVYIPNEKIIANRLINYNVEGIRRIDLIFNAGYEFEPTRVIDALHEAVKSVETVNSERNPVIGIADYAESAIEYSVWVWTDSDKYFDTKFAVMQAVSDSYKKHGISMAYNRLEVEMINKEDNA